jgi:hypothetical protein
VNSGGLARAHKGTVSIVHAIAPTSTAAIAIPAALAGSAAVLAIMLWLGRQGADAPPQLVPIEARVARTPAQPPHALQSRMSITYHSGGLYGP